MTIPSAVRPNGVAPTSRGLVGRRHLVAVQTLDIGRLPTHPVYLASSCLIAVTGKGPVDSNESSKTTLFAAVSLLLGDPAWRLDAPQTGQHAAKLLFNPPNTVGIAAGLESLDARELRWLTSASRRSAARALDRVGEAGLHVAARAGLVRLLHDLAPDRRGITRLHRVEPDPDAAGTLAAWRDGRDAARDDDAIRVAEAWRGHGDPNRIAERVRQERDPLRRGRIAEVLVALAGRLPGEGTPLASLAAEVAGDAHALDGGTRLGGVAVLGAALVAGREPPQDALERHAVWEAVGVVPDPWSSSVVGWRLPLVASHPAGAVAAAYDRAGCAALLSLEVVNAGGALVEPPPDDGPATLWVVENASLLAALIEAEVDAPVLWRAGNPSAAVRRVLQAVAQAGWTVAVGSDFEPVGLRGAISVLEVLGARGCPWRLSTDDYDPDLTADTFEGDPPDTPWDPDLALELRRHRRRVLEEHRMEVLVADVVEGRTP